MRDFHEIQIKILQVLLYSNGLPFSKIQPLNVESSKFTFHLDQLINQGIIVKKDSTYYLSESGKDLANTMDLGDKQIPKQAKISVLLVAMKKDKKDLKYLLYTRLKSPFYGFQGFPTGKVRYGENILDSAIRELKEETGLIGKPKIFSIKHYKIRNRNGELIEDKIFYCVKFTNPKGEIVPNPEGNYAWIDNKDVWTYLKNPVQEIESVFKDLKRKHIVFSEAEYSTDKF